MSKVHAHKFFFALWFRFQPKVSYGVHLPTPLLGLFLQPAVMWCTFSHGSEVMGCRTGEQTGSQKGKQHGYRLPININQPLRCYSHLPALHMLSSRGAWEFQYKKGIEVNQWWTRAKTRSHITSWPVSVSISGQFWVASVNVANTWQIQVTVCNCAKKTWFLDVIHLKKCRQADLAAATCSVESLSLSGVNSRYCHP